MSENFAKVKQYLLDLNYTIKYENEEESLFVIDNPDYGISNMLIDCEDPILVLEQFIFELKSDDSSVLRELLQLNREIIHGAFTIDESGKKVLFRDTLALENLDLNELESSINSLSLLLSEHSEKIIDFSKK